MRKLISIFICLLPFFIEAQTKWYIDPSGNDVSGNGTSGSPWLSLHKASQMVTTPGDTIMVNAGTYTETQPAMIAVGVSIKGVGISSHIISNYKANWHFNEPSDAAIALVSTTEGTNGNQSISNILLDGNNLTGNLGIIVRCRSNVSIHDLSIKDFYINGISYFGNATNYDNKPTTYSINNRLYNVHIDNCTDSAETWVGGALININGQKDLWIYNSFFSDTSRAPGRNGDIITNNRWGMGFKYYNNTSYKPSSINDYWNWHLEIPYGIGGTEIYNNNFYGGDHVIDIGLQKGYDEVTYPTFSYSIHDNYFQDIDLSQDGSFGKSALVLEGYLVKNVSVYNNTFKNIARVFGINDGWAGISTSVDSNIVIRNNVCMNTGLTSAGTYMDFVTITKTVGNIYGLYIINNTIIPNSTVNATTIRIYNTSTPMKNIVVANNIITDNRNTYWFNIDNTGSASMDSLIVRNNILYNNNSNVVNFNGNAVTNYINSGNINLDPKFNAPPYDLSLQSTSPAINAAYPYGYGSDIGGLQYQSVAAPTISLSGNQSIDTTFTNIYATPVWASGHTGTVSWTKISGGSATIESPNSTSTGISGLINGTYIFRCTATQDDSQTVSGTVSVTVSIPVQSISVKLHRRYIFINLN